ARAFAEQRSDFCSRARVDLPALGRTAGPAVVRCGAVAAETRRILNVHCGLRSGEIERFQGEEQSPGADRSIENLYQECYVCPENLQCWRGCATSNQLKELGFLNDRQARLHPGPGPRKALRPRRRSLRRDPADLV